MNALPPAPATLLDGQQPRFGTYAGAFGEIDLKRLSGTGAKGRFHRLTKLKRWQYTMIATDAITLAYAIVDVGYAANAFIFAADRERILVDRSFLGIPRVSVSVGDRPADGARARFKARGAELAFAWDGPLATAHAAVGGLALDARIDTSSAAPLTLVAPVPEGIVNVTQKVAILPTEGSLVIDERRFDLAGGLAGLDYTHGLLARETAWRWAFGLGRASDGTPVGFNLVEGFNTGGGGEDAVWTPQGIEVLPAPAFDFQRDATLKPWAIRGGNGALDLRFESVGEHREERDLVVARSRFIQVVGRFRGTIPAGGRSLVVEGIPGVTEDQQVRW
jgi:hypothetical protein